MAMVCPQCKNSYEQQLQCPACGVRLLFQAQLPITASTAAEPEEGGWQKTPWGRLVAGLLLAQGLSYGMKLFLTAGFLASGEDAAQTVWQTLFGILLLHGVMGFSLVVGGALVGAGQAKGALYGILLGLVNCIVALVTQQGKGEPLGLMTFYGQPIMHMAFGGLGGMLGSWIWRPVPTVALPPGSSAPLRGISTGALTTLACLAGPVAWARVLMGTAVVVGGVVWSNAILEWVLEASQGSLNISTHLQAKLINWEITAIAALFGAGLAGATTFNSMKQGLCVGLIAGVILLGIYLGSPKAVLESTVLTIISVAVLSLAGGWFGGQMFPPVLSTGRRRGIGIG